MLYCAHVVKLCDTICNDYVDFSAYVFSHFGEGLQNVLFAQRQYLYRSEKSHVFIFQMEKLTRKRKQPTDRLSVGPSATKVKRQESTHNDETEGPMAEAMHAVRITPSQCTLMFTQILRCHVYRIYIQRTSDIVANLGHHFLALISDWPLYPT